MSRERELLQLMQKTGYNMDQKNGQRIYGPPPDWKGVAPERGSEIFVGKIPRDCYEDVLVPAFETCGKIYQLRLMMDFSGSNRGYCFVMYTHPGDARLAVSRMNNFEIQHGRFLGVCMSLDNCQLFFGNIPPHITQQQLFGEINSLTDDVVSVNIKPQERYAYVEYKNHRAAAMARRKLIPGKIKLFNYPITVDWAEPKTDIADDRSIFIQGIPMGVSEEQIRNVFNESLTGGYVDHVKKMKDSALVHFLDINSKDRGLSLWKTNGQNLFHNQSMPNTITRVQNNDLLNSFSQLSLNGGRLQMPCVFPQQTYLPMYAPANFQVSLPQNNYAAAMQHYSAPMQQAAVPRLALPAMGDGNASSSAFSIEKFNELCAHYGFLAKFELHSKNTPCEAGDVQMFIALMKIGDRTYISPESSTPDLAKECVINQFYNDTF